MGHLSLAGDFLAMFRATGLFKATRFLHKRIPFKLADIGEGISEVQIIQWHVDEGSKIKQFEKIAEVQSDKATVEITSRYDGIVKKLHYKTNEMAKVGEPLIDIETDEKIKNQSEEPSTQIPEETCPKTTEQYPRSEQKSDKWLMMPSVRKFIKDNDIDLSKLDLSNAKDGKISKDEILAALASSNVCAEYLMNPVQKAMARVMEESLKIPHFGYCDEYRMDNLLKIRSEYSPKVSMLAFIIKAITTSVKKVPTINAHYKDGKLFCSSAVNLGIAIDTPQGLVAPVLKNIEKVTEIQEISDKLLDLTDRARRNKLLKEDFEGATLTISNIGTIGGTYASPVIIPPQVCIVAIGKIRTQAIFTETGAIEPHKMAAFSWSADHRAVDGATMARFSNLVKESIEHPSPHK